MNKSVEAFIRGYIYFDVNGDKFWCYNSALSKRKAIEGSVQFCGLHVLKGWQTFYLKISYES